MTDIAHEISSPPANDGFLVAALYHFVSVPRFAELRAPLQTLCEENGVRGTLLLAHEGINGTIAGPAAGIRTVLSFLRSQPEFSGLEHKESQASAMPFLRMKVRLKKEIVTMGVEDIDPTRSVGTYVDPQDWNALISDPDTIVIDTRNDYETAIGIFKGAVDPNTKTFREFPDWVRNNTGLHNKPKIAMYCTGGIRTVLSFLRSQPEFSGLEHKESQASAMPFLRMKVRLKKEIVTMGVEDIDPTRSVGTYVDPQDWNALISDPDTIVIDTRNDYETAIGIFKGAVDPNTKTFREFPDWVRNNTGLHNKPKIAMYCTGGIRCEKATAFMKEEGFEEVYHLKGGILKYLEEVSPEESLWEGACFVFDERVSVLHGLEEGDLKLCRACRHPLTAEEIASPLYEAGVSCAHCHGTRSDEDRLRFRQRQKQMDLAKQRGERHLGK